MPELEASTQNYRTVAVAAALQAGKIIADAYRTDFQVYYKEGTLTNLVTEVDRRSEAAIVEVLCGSFPKDHILAEEGGKLQERGRRTDGMSIRLTAPRTLRMASQCSASQSGLRPRAA